MMPLLWALCKATKCNINEAEKLIQEGKDKCARNKGAPEKKSKCSSVTSNKSEVILHDPPARLSVNDGNFPLDLSVKTFCKSIKRRITADSCENNFNCHEQVQKSFEFPSKINSYNSFEMKSVKTNGQVAKSEPVERKIFSVVSLLNSPESNDGDQTTSNFSDENSKFRQNNLKS